MTANNFKEFIRENFSELDSEVCWIWTERYRPKLTDKFRKKLVRLLREYDNNKYNKCKTCGK